MWAAWQLSQSDHSCDLNICTPQHSPCHIPSVPHVDYFLLLDFLIQIYIPTCPYNKVDF